MCDLTALGCAHKLLPHDLAPESAFVASVEKVREKESAAPHMSERMRQNLAGAMKCNVLGPCKPVSTKSDLDRAWPSRAASVVASKYVWTLTQASHTY
jgi:hypothetical protein